MLSLINLVLRGLQLVFGAVVLGLSINAIQWQAIGGAPATTSYSAFAGAFCMLVALIGIAAVWINKLAGLIMAGFDTLAAVLLVAGGIAFAVGMRNTDCGDTYAESNNHLINGGCTNNGDFCSFKDEDEVEGRCHMAKADTAFLFLAFAATAGAAVISLIQMKRK